MEVLLEIQWPSGLSFPASACVEGPVEVYEKSSGAPMATGPASAPGLIADNFCNQLLLNIALQLTSNLWIMLVHSKIEVNCLSG